MPIVNKSEHEVADIDEDNFVSLIMGDGSIKDDLKLPNDEDLREELFKVWNDNKDTGSILFTVISACKQEKIISARVQK